MFVIVVASIQYRALADRASDAFYRLSNTKDQIQAYVFDGILPFFLSSRFLMPSELDYTTTRFQFQVTEERARGDRASELRVTERERDNMERWSFRKVKERKSRWVCLSL